LTARIAVPKQSEQKIKLQPKAAFPFDITGNIPAGIKMSKIMVYGESGLFLHPLSPYSIDAIKTLFENLCLS
jgi:hypothetical protein